MYTVCICFHTDLGHKMLEAPDDLSIQIGTDFDPTFVIKILF